jgi:hypothetical protein
MRRLSMETAEAAEPDAALMVSGPGRGHPEGSGRWPIEALRGVAVGGASCTSSGPRAAAHEWRKIRSVLQGWCGASLKHRARDAGGTGGLAVFIHPECPGVARCQGPWVRRSFHGALRTPGVPRPLGLSLIQAGD